MFRITPPPVVFSVPPWIPVPVICTNDPAPSARIVPPVLFRSSVAVISSVAPPVALSVPLLVFWASSSRFIVNARLVLLAAMVPRA